MGRKGRSDAGDVQWGDFRWIVLSVDLGPQKTILGKRELSTLTRFSTSKHKLPSQGKNQDQDCDPKSYQWPIQ